MLDSGADADGRTVLRSARGPAAAEHEHRDDGGRSKKGGHHFPARILRFLYAFPLARLATPWPPLSLMMPFQVAMEALEPLAPST